MASACRGIAPSVALRRQPPRSGADVCAALADRALDVQRIYNEPDIKRFGTPGPARPATTQTPRAVTTYGLAGRARLQSARGPVNRIVASHEACLAACLGVRRPAQQGRHGVVLQPLRRTVHRFEVRGRDALVRDGQRPHPMPGSARTGPGDLPLLRPGRPQTHQERTGRRAHREQGRACALAPPRHEQVATHPPVTSTGQEQVTPEAVVIANSTAGVPTFRATVQTDGDPLNVGPPGRQTDRSAAPYLARPSPQVVEAGHARA